MFGVGNGAGNALMLWLLLCPRPKSRIPAWSCTRTLPLFDDFLVSSCIPGLLGQGLEQPGIMGGVEWQEVKRAGL